MVTLEMEGYVSFEVPGGNRLLNAIEDSGIDILHRCVLHRCGATPGAQPAGLSSIEVNRSA